MRGARLLQILLLLQNRGRTTSAALARELEVSRRTILRDLDAMTEAGLPVIVYPGAGGGIELGFDYRSQMTALTQDEAEALGLMLAAPHRALDRIGLGQAARRAAGKIVESQSSKVRASIQAAQAAFPISACELGDIDARGETDSRLSALARAVRAGNIVTLRSRSAAPRAAHPVALGFDGGDWWLRCARSNSRIDRPDWGDIQISARRFAPDQPGNAPVRT